MLPQGECQCLDLCYEALLTRGNLVSFIISLAEYVINSYSVTVLDNFRKETSERAKKSIFWGRYSTASLSFWGIPTPTSIVHHLGRRFDEGITLTV